MNLSDLGEFFEHHKIAGPITAIRNTASKYPQFAATLPKIAKNRPDLYRAYQQFQAKRSEGVIRRSRFIASFLRDS